jgi:glucose/arabinose dehydrogenase
MEKRKRGPGRRAGRPAALAWLLVACSSVPADNNATPGNGGAQAAAPNAAAQEQYRVVPVVEGLENPWSMAFLPNGDMLVTEKAGRLRMIRGGQLQSEPIGGVPAVLARGQGGLLDVVLHPGFANNRLVYLSYSKPNVNGNQNTTAVIRGRLEGNQLTNVQEIFEARAYSGGGGHFGSRMVFDRNGFLFITVGDRQVSPSLNSPTAGRNHPAQSLASHHGKVIRLHDDGRVPTDNPFVDRAGALPEIWSYGHRNLQGLALHPQTGDLWETEHAPQGGDELNIIQRGRNYGWPVIGMGVNYGGAVIHEDTIAAGMELPVHYWKPSIGTSGLMIYNGDKFPQWRGNAFAGGLVGQQIARLTLNGRRVTSSELIFQRQGRVRDIRQGPDGFIYIAIDRNTPPSIVRLEPTR